MGVALAVAVAVAALLPSVAFADTVSSSDFSSIITAITAQISVSTVVEVLVYAVGVAIAFVFLWWGIRKAVQIVMSAFRNGSVSL